MTANTHINDEKEEKEEKEENSANLVHQTGGSCTQDSRYSSW